MNANFYQSVWNLVNTNIVSSLFGALIFGLIATYIFTRYEEKRSSKEVITKLIDIMLHEIDANLALAHELHSLALNQCHITPAPFHLAAMEVTLKSSFFYRLSTALEIQIVSLMKDLSEMNQIHTQFHQCTFSSIAALTSAQSIKTHLFGAINTAMPNAERELNELKRLLLDERTKFSSE